MPHRNFQQALSLLFGWLLAGIFTAPVALAVEVIPGRYIVELTAEPVASVITGKAARRAAVQTQQRSARELIADRGVDVANSVEVVANALFVHATEEQAAALQSVPGVAAVYPVHKYKLLLDRAILLQKATEAWSLVGGKDNAGAGVKIAIIDTGIDNTHPGFQDSSLPSLQNFPKVGKDSDLAYTNNKVIVARTYSNGGGSAKDIEGHGTHVAMIAAGVTNSGPLAVITGIAPKAYLGNYKVFPDAGSGAGDDDIIHALEDAVTDGMDIANLSLGGFPAARPANDPLARAVTRAVAAGMIVTVAAGNEGPDANTIGSPATAAAAIAVGNAQSDRIFATSVQVEGGDAVLSVAGDSPAPAKPISAALLDVFALDPTGLACAALPAGSMRGRVALILRGECNFSEKIQHAADAGAVAALLYARPESPDPVSMSAAGVTLPAMMVSSSDGLAIRDRLRSGAAAISLNFSSAAVAVNANKLSGGSSRGPSADLALKPDLLAVGGSVYSAAPMDSSYKGYRVASGTSMSSPMVAGAAAVLKSARPGLTAEQYKSLLVNSASTFSYDSALPAPVLQTGTGRLDVSAAVGSTIAAVPSSVSFGISESAINATRTVSITNLSNTSDTVSISVEALGNNGLTPLLSNTTLRLIAGQSQSFSLQMAANGLQPGEYSGFAVIRSTQTASVAKVPYWFGVPSGAAQSLYIAEAPASGRRSSTQTFYVRAIDASGIPVLTDPTVTAVSGGSVVSTQSMDRSYPGFYLVQVRLGATRGVYVFEVEVGGVKQQVTISAS